ncbi:hypothetical protein T10_4854 [Trichinella papuae]|uniref:Uncharacterized protein n=1 Tax=Trichinella papuae TaxID=268474 RepID=A0A0V1MFN6_9BILA|nr:hypothetical protein T10_4854 [Trichinella papuae]
MDMNCTFSGKLLCNIPLRAISHMSLLLSFQTCAAILYSSIMKLQRIISGKTDVQTFGQKFRQWITVVGQKQTVVAQWRHGNANLTKIIQVLQYGHFAQQQAVGNAFCGHEAGHQMIHRTCFTAVWSQAERVEASESV